MSNVLSHGQSIALNHHLAGYPENVSFETVMDMIIDGDEEVDIWCYFEEWDANALTEHLTKLAHSIDKAVIESKNEESHD